MNLLDATAEFHRLAEFPEGEWVLPNGKTVGGQAPMTKQAYEEMREFRRNLMREEIREYFDAEASDNLVETIDGLLDIIVIAWGTALTYVGALKAHMAAYEVARSNLTKVNGELGPILRREDGKILKPEGWEPPDIKGVLGLG